MLKSFVALAFAALLISTGFARADAKTYEPCSALSQDFARHNLTPKYRSVLMNSIGCQSETETPAQYPCGHIAYRYAKAILRLSGGTFWTTATLDPISFVAEHTEARSVTAGTCNQWEDGSYGPYTG